MTPAGLLARTAAFGLLIAATSLAPLVVTGSDSYQSRGLVFDPGNVIDIGEIEPGTHDVTLSVRNEFDQEIVLGSVSASCGCTEATVTENRLAPGRAADIRLTIEATPGMEKAVGVFVDTREPWERRFVAMVHFRAGTGGRVTASPTIVREFGVRPGTPLAYDVSATLASADGECLAVRWSIDPPVEGTSIKPVSGSVANTAGQRSCAVLRLDPIAPRSRLQSAVIATFGSPPVASVRIPFDIVSARCVTSDQAVVRLRPVAETGGVRGRLVVEEEPGWMIREVRGESGIEVVWTPGSGEIVVSRTRDGADDLWSSEVLVTCEGEGGALATTHFPVLAFGEEDR